MPSTLYKSSKKILRILLLLLLLILLSVKYFIEKFTNDLQNKARNVEALKPGLYNPAVLR